VPRRSWGPLAGPSPVLVHERGVPEVICRAAGASRCFAGRAAVSADRAGLGRRAFRVGWRRSGSARWLECAIQTSRRVGLWARRAGARGPVAPCPLAAPPARASRRERARPRRVALARAPAGRPAAPPARSGSMPRAYSAGPVGGRPRRPAQLPASRPLRPHGRTGPADCARAPRPCGGAAYTAHRPPWDGGHARGGVSWRGRHATAMAGSLRPRLHARAGGAWAATGAGRGSFGITGYAQRAPARAGGCPGRRRAALWTVAGGQARRRAVARARGGGKVRVTGGARALLLLPSEGMEESNMDSAHLQGRLGCEGPGAQHGGWGDTTAGLGSRRHRRRRPPPRPRAARPLPAAPRPRRAAP
jgi:hypothetical protein